MCIFLPIRGADVAIAAIAVTALMTEPAWASLEPELPGPAVGILAVAAVIGAILVARWWRRK